MNNLRSKHKQNTQGLFKSILVLLILLFWAGCKSDKQMQMPVPEIPVVEVMQKNVPVFQEFVGEVQGEKDIPIRARVEGFLEGIHFNEGLKVVKGQLLYTIDPEPFEARVNAQMSKVAEAETMLAKAKSDLDRYKPLAEKKAVSESDLDAAQAQYDAALSSVKAAQANLRSSQIELGYTKIYSPINGIIGKTEAKVGDFVGREPNPVILNVVSETNQVKVIFFLTESEYLEIAKEIASIEDYESKREELRAEREGVLELILADGALYDQKGTIDFIDRGIDVTTGSILIQGSFPNPEFILRPGLFAKVRVRMAEVENAILIPQRCIMELQGQRSVFVVNDSNKVETRQIITGPKIDDYWLVSEGLQANEKVVIDALQKVQSGLEVKPTVVQFESKTHQQ